MIGARLSVAVSIAAILLLPTGILGPGSSGLSIVAPAHAESKFRARVESKLREIIERFRGRTLPEGIVGSNGRIEATQIDVAAKYAGRLAEVTVQEGDEVEAGQVIARIASPEYEAQLRGAQSQVLRAKKALAEAKAVIVQRTSEATFAATDLERGRQLVDRHILTQQTFDQRLAKADAAKAALAAAEAQREQAEFAIKTADADVERIEAILVDLVLVAPRSGRVQYQLARAGEVVGAGTRVLTLLDLSDVYLTIYLPAAQAGMLALGDDARIILDPFPKYVVPASISFVAADAQFTPKSVETAEEREKLMFRIKLQVDPKVLKKYRRNVKTGVRGMGFVRTRGSVDWPDDLAVKLP